MDPITRISAGRRSGCRYHYFAPQKKDSRNIEKPEIMDNLTDFHCHILPGVDDGSEDMDMTLQILDLSYAQACGESLPLPIITGAMWKMSRRSFTKS